MHRREFNLLKHPQDAGGADGSAAVPPRFPAPRPQDRAERPGLGPDAPTLDMTSPGWAQTAADRTIDWSTQTATDSTLSGRTLSDSQHDGEADAATDPARSRGGTPVPVATPISRAPHAGGASAPVGVGASGLPNAGAEGLPVIEGYEIIRRAGKGGMGEVFDATQLATGRRVAIKLLPEAALMSELARQRFAREVEVIARLQHPGIVPIIDSGVRKGLYFYVMDFVEGESLDHVLPPGACDPTLAIQTLIEICESVDYAHQRGVLHRDLKPSNVMVDKNGKPHLLDFGLAKQTGNEDGASPQASGLTIAGAGQLLGTVAFMSPEQAAGNADQTSVRSDVYSLGVMGYLLLTGRLPISMNGSLREVLTWIADKEPTPPSRVKATFGADIDAIFLKCLEKDPEARYATAGEFAADMRRYLRDEPILARPISSMERSIRWTRRNKTLSATIAAATATLLIVSGVLIARIVAERDRANANALQSARNAEAAEAAAQEARTREEEARASEDRAKQELKRANESRDFFRNILTPPQLAGRGEVKLTDLLDLGVERLNKTPPDSPETEAVVREVLASIYQSVGRYAKARTNYERALMLRERLVALDPTVRPQLATTMHNLAAAMWWQRDYQTAEPLYVRALRLRKELYPGDNLDVSTSMMHLGACLLNMGKHDEAHDLYEQALAMRKRLDGAKGGKSEQVAQALNNLAKSYSEREDFAKAEALYTQAFEMIVALRGPDHAGTAATTQNLAQCLLDEGKVSQARDLFAQAKATREKLFPSGHPLIANTMVGLARAELALGNAREARTWAGDALAAYEKIDYEQPVDLAEARAVLGQSAMALGERVEGLRLLREAVLQMAAANNPPLAQLAELRADLGEALLATGSRDEGLRELEEAYELGVRARGASSKLATQLLLRVQAAHGS